MAFTVPNQSGSIEDPTGVYPQAQLDSVDLQILAAAVGGVNGVSSGCAVTAQGSPDNTVAVASGTFVINGAEGTVSSGNVTMTAAHATLPRFDLITVNSSGTKAYTTGTAAATPVFPAIPANSVVLAAIYVDSNDNVINSNQIVDKRVTVPTPSSVGNWTTLEKSVTLGKQNDTTLANDPDLLFTMAANGEYRIRGALFGLTEGATSGGLKVRLTGPASPIRVFFHIRIPNATTGLEAGSTRIENAYSATDIVWITASAGLANVLYFDGVVSNLNAGNFAVQWAQNASDADFSYLLQGSYLEYARVD